MKSYLKSIIAIAVILGLCLPISFFTTILLIPLWRWIESRFNIESIGHSGPDEWCFWAVYAVFVIISIVGYRRLRCIKY